jgi:hypothetical protein
MTWNKKLQEFAIKNHYWQSSTNLSCYISKDVDPNKPTEYMLRREDFQKYMKKLTGEEYHRTTVRKALYDMVEKSQGMYVILEDFSRGKYKIMVFPLAWVTENKKPRQESRHNENCGNPMYSEAHKKKLKDQQQQEKDIEIIKGCFDKLGMQWSREALLKIWRMAGNSVDNVKDAIDFMLHANTTQSEPIRKPHGWFIRCMERGEYKMFAHQLLYQLPRFNSKVDLMGYITTHLYGDPVPIPSQ